MMKRKLMMVERIMYVNSETPVNCVFTARIKGRIDKGDLRSALSKIQKKHPLLRVKIDNTTEKYPFFVEEKEIEPIPFYVVNRKTDDDWLQESKNEWYSLFDDDKKPLAKVVWIRGEETSEILWVIPHCICDGTSLVALMKELLFLLDDPCYELSPYQIFNSVNDFLPQDFNLKKKKRKANFYLLLAKGFFLMQRRSKKISHRNNYVIHWKLDSQITKHITGKCKTHEISVHSLLSTAFMKAFQEIQGSSAKGKVISPVDVRHFIPEIKQDHIFAFAPTVELSLKKGNADILENSKHIKKDLVQKIEKMEARELLWMGEHMHPVVERMVSMLNASKGGHDITLSNMGKIDIQRKYRNFKLETIFSPTVAFPWLNSNTLVATTYNQEMDFMFVSNESFLPKEEAAKIKDKAIELLTSSL
ncbi:condensation domain-containing protein [Chryseobacterium sp. ERMR1:04]|uniref:condensation domain-containing protein n=1 Tax=Chryseobacterium sp. ERMR1:04 TaxID=1705393 RepID=UPI0009E8F969|nr:condensation domain-containing protein [Chryseobacterium sp. ERMR1:04]